MAISIDRRHTNRDPNNNARFIILTVMASLIKINGIRNLIGVYRWFALMEIPQKLTSNPPVIMTIRRRMR
jgi:hypothetical protein